MLYCISKCYEWVIVTENDVAGNRESGFNDGIKEIQVEEPTPWTPPIMANGNSSALPGFLIPYVSFSLSLRFICANVHTR